MGHTVGELSWKNVVFVYLAERLWKGVLRLAVSVNSLSCRVFWLQRVPVFEGHRMPSTGSRWDIRWVRGGRNSNFCVFSLAIVERGFEACG
jgi:hypothetical protein